MSPWFYSPLILFDRAEGARVWLKTAFSAPQLGKVRRLKRFPIGLRGARSVEELKGNGVHLDEHSVLKVGNGDASFSSSSCHFEDILRLGR